jgi:hypothetical protein
MADVRQSACVPDGVGGESKMQMLLGKTNPAIPYDWSTASLSRWQEFLRGQSARDVPGRARHVTDSHWLCRSSAVVSLAAAYGADCRRRHTPGLRRTAAVNVRVK